MPDLAALYFGRHGFDGVVLPVLLEGVYQLLGQQGRHADALHHHAARGHGAVHADEVDRELRPDAISGRVLRRLRCLVCLAAF